MSTVTSSVSPLPQATPARGRNSSGECGKVGTRAQGRGWRSLPQTAGSFLPLFPCLPVRTAGASPARCPLAGSRRRHRLGTSPPGPWTRLRSAGRDASPDSLAPTAEGHRPVKEGLGPPRCRARVRGHACAEARRRWAGGQLGTARAGPGQRRGEGGALEGGGRGGGSERVGGGRGRELGLGGGTWNDTEGWGGS